MPSLLVPPVPAPPSLLPTSSAPSQSRRGEERVTSLLLSVQRASTPLRGHSELRTGLPFSCPSQQCGQTSSFFFVCVCCSFGYWHGGYVPLLPARSHICAHCHQLLVPCTRMSVSPACLSFACSMSVGRKGTFSFVCWGVYVRLLDVVCLFARDNLSQMCPCLRVSSFFFLLASRPPCRALLSPSRPSLSPLPDACFLLLPHRTIDTAREAARTRCERLLSARRESVQSGG